MTSITLETRISRLLKDHPDLLEVLTSANPHFERLRNPVLRKMMAPLVTVRDAAKVARMDPVELLRILNGAAHGPGAPEMPEQGAGTCSGGEEFGGQGAGVRCAEKTIPDIPWKDLDVRAIIASGQEPFDLIMETVKGLSAGEGLHLVAPFEPAPLLRILAGKGFSHALMEEEGAFHVYFFRSRESKDASSAGEGVSHRVGDLPGHVVELDVRGLPPPEPFVRIMETLSSLPRNGLVLVHHSREPFPLYDQLAERGFTSRTEKIAENHYEIRISHKETDPSSKKGARRGGN
ncbi:MAG: DUF2249 domain-containing protein [Armatimonadetes bacterium]|nr:DUF2249 domain-containing protein [Armatimonadota bacterium]